MERDGAICQNLNLRRECVDRNIHNWTSQHVTEWEGRCNGTAPCFVSQSPHKSEEHGGESCKRNQVSSLAAGFLEPQVRSEIKRSDYRRLPAEMNEGPPEGLQRAIHCSPLLSANIFRTSSNS